ncbi:hypothetical protein P8452_35269 [Trifolium repens]|nr:hypothetical protein P8452_35269 [Trifolium repens]
MQSLGQVVPSLGPTTTHMDNFTLHPFVSSIESNLCNRATTLLHSHIIYPKLMEESGENWPSESDLVIGDDVIFEDGDQSESVCGDREIKEKLMALSATIGLNKMDDTTILDKAKHYVENLQKRVKELEQEVVNSSVLRFGKSILDITIVAQMGDGHNITVDELVKTLRLAISTQ